MDEIIKNLLYIINNYKTYRDGKDYLDELNISFNLIILKLKTVLTEYEIEFNNIQGKPNKPFIPLIAIRNKLYSSNMTEGVYVAILIKPDTGVYISLNQGTENKSRENIQKVSYEYKNKVNMLLKTHKIDSNSRASDKINLSDNLSGNIKRPKSYEYGNIMCVFYDKKRLKDYKEAFLRDLIWIMELYKLVLI